MGQARLRNSNGYTLSGTVKSKSFRKNPRLPTGLFCRDHDVVTQNAPGISQSRDRLALKNQDDVSWVGSATVIHRQPVKGLFR
jgi:hypothetical protein